MKARSCKAVARSETDFPIMIPTSILRVWFLGLFSFVLIGVGLYFSHQWYKQAWSYDFERQQSYFDPHLGFNGPTLLLAVVAGLLLWTLPAGSSSEPFLVF